MTSPIHATGAKLATRLSFLTAGLGMACWAPLVPLAKARIGANDSQLGLMLLCLGIGSLLAMPLTGLLSARLGSKPMIIAGGFGLAMLLPLLSITKDSSTLAAALLGFGASLGTIDVAMNIHAVEVEREARQPLMSGFHAMFSVGGFIGAGGMTFLLSAGVPPLVTTISNSMLTIAAVCLAWPRLLPARGEPAPLVAPHGIVLLLACLCAITFLIEGAILDWSALLVINMGLANTDQGGFGYMLFSVAMTFGRLTGDRLAAHMGDRRVLILGGSATVAGFVLLLTALLSPIAMTGFLLIGLGASNIVPVLFRLAGSQKVMPTSLAVAVLTTTGYAGILVGPAGIGFISGIIGLQAAFWLLAALMSLVPFLARWVASA